MERKISQNNPFIKTQNNEQSARTSYGRELGCEEEGQILLQNDSPQQNFRKRLQRG